jgi:hypothetical protein
VPGAVVRAEAVVAVVAAVVETTAAPQASPAATDGDGAAVVAEPGSYSTPQLCCLLALGGRLPHKRPVAATEPPRPVLLTVPVAPRAGHLGSFPLPEGAGALWLDWLGLGSACRGLLGEASV